MPSPHRKPPRSPVVAQGLRTTTIKLTHDLKQHLDAAAAAVGKSPHAFMVESISSAVAAQERRRSFVAEALEAEAEFDRVGRSVSAGAVDTFLAARAAGKKPPLPKARPWRK